MALSVRDLSAGGAGRGERSDMRIQKTKRGKIQVNFTLEALDIQHFILRLNAP
jgi:hypothetical protein